MGRGPAAETAGLASEKRLRQVSPRSAGVASVAAYVAAVAACEIARRLTGFPEPSDVAVSPAALAAGKLWLLFTSAFLVSGPPLAELAGLTLAAVLLVRRAGPAAFWRAAIAGHVGATLIVYAGVGVLWLADRGAVAGVVDDRDFGVSGVWLGVLGALFAIAWRSPRGRRSGLDRLVAAACLIAAAIGAIFFPRSPAPSTPSRSRPERACSWPGASASPLIPSPLEHILGVWLFGGWSSAPRCSRSSRPARPRRM